jgi:LysM repeat protein
MAEWWKMGRLACTRPEFTLPPGYNYPMVTRRSIKAWSFRLITLAFTLVLLLAVSAPASAQPSVRVWGSRPLLSYFALTQSLVEPFQHGADLTDAQFALVEQVAYREAANLQSLFQESQVLLAGDAPLFWKRLRLVWMGYNRRVDAITSASDAQLQLDLGPLAYQRLVAWIEARWPLERQVHTEVFAHSNATASAPRTFRVYATRYDSNGRYTAALPDKCVKFTNGGSSVCADDGYQVGVRYEIFITYKKSVGVVVAESGPWNVDDAYWATWNDPTPRRMFADVGLGIPEAQAAYFNGYNGGKDQFGRKVTGPYGIDLAREVSVDIGLKPGKNDWVTVTYQWTAGWGGSGSGGNTPRPAGTSVAGPTAQAIVPAEAATPQPDGSIVHLVQPGQTLWEIATTYSVTLRTLYNLNGLNEKSVIWPGDKLLVRPASPTGIASPTATDLPTSTPIIIDATGTAWAALAIGTQAVETVMAQIYAAQVTSSPSSSVKSPAVSPIVIIVLAVILLGGVLLLVGKLLS